LSLRAGIAISAAANPEDQFAAADLKRALKERGIRLVSPGTPGAVSVRLVRRPDAITDSAMRGEGYRISSAERRITVTAATSAGLFYGAQTIKQLVTGHGPSARLHQAEIEDWPALRWRGIHDDLSRGPLPTLEFQKRQIRTFAAYKLNVYSPYYEHTLAYRDHPLIAPPGGAMSPEQVRELVAYAGKYHVTVIPEQEAFGHLHHVLKHERYADLAETPHGHVLAPDAPGTLALARSWFVEIDSLFPGPFVHLGADETFELGRGRTAARVTQEGIGPVYIQFLSRLVDTLQPTTKRFLFWADVAKNHAELVGSLPKGMIAVGWDYWSRQGFDHYLKPFRDVGMETWVAPGVNNWNRVWPDYAVALPNIQGFVREGQAGGSTGMLNTTWDDDGEALFNQTWYGVLFGAAASWQPGESDIAVFQRSFGSTFHGDSSGAIDSAQMSLITAHRLLDSAGVGDASDYLFWLDPWSFEGKAVGEKLQPYASRVRLAAEAAIEAIVRARQDSLREADALDAMDLGARRVDLIAQKFQLANEVNRLYQLAYDSAGTRGADWALIDISSMNGKLQDLRDAYTEIRELYQAAWLRENRPYWLQNVLARYDAQIQLWIARADRVSAARRAMPQTRSRPPPQEIFR